MERFKYDVGMLDHFREATKVLGEVSSRFINLINAIKE